MDSTDRGASLPIEGHFPSLGGATDWINSPPLDPGALRGSVVLVEFLTYTCINWLRTLPYVRAWAERYRADGLVVIGVHTPEFSFEHDVGNIQQALKQLDVTFPIAVDERYAVWDAFANHYWPALHFIDAQSQRRHHVFGEGDYERSEAVIRELLTSAGADGIGDDTVAIVPTGPEVQADWANLRSRETYLGFKQTSNFGSPGGIYEGRSHEYTVPKRLPLNGWALSGRWMANPENVAGDEPGGRIVFRFHSRDVHLVMGPAARGMTIPFRVSIDGEDPDGAAGSDVDESGIGVLVEQRMYQLIRQEGRIKDRAFSIEFLDQGAEAFAFTFG